MNHTTSEAIVSNSFRRALGRYLLAGALALALLGGASTAQAETHAVIPTAPPTVISINTKSIAVDSVHHFVFSVNASEQVQVTFIVNNAWATAALGAGQPVKAGTKLYVDTTYPYVFYVGADDRLWVWFVSGQSWVNAQLNATEVATDLVGVDSGFHYLWFRNGGQLRALFSTGLAWVGVSSGVNDCAAFAGGAVDDAAHSLYWNDTSAGSLRGLFYTGRVFIDRTIDTTVNTTGRPAVHQGTGEVYCENQSDRQLFRELPAFTFFRQNVGVTSAPFDTTIGLASIGVHSASGRVFYNTAAAPGGIAVLTPSGPGAGATWTRSFVAGTPGQIVLYSGMDNVNAFYFYTIVGDNSLHIVF
jgi:hypothetical protein